jgi:hypothetical protein
MTNSGVACSSQDNIAFTQVTFCGFGGLSGVPLGVLWKVKLPSLAQGNGVAVVHKVDAVEMSPAYARLAQEDLPVDSARRQDMPLQAGVHGRQRFLRDGSGNAAHGFQVFL